MGPPRKFSPGPELTDEGERGGRGNSKPWRSHAKFRKLRISRDTAAAAFPACQKNIGFRATRRQQHFLPPKKLWGGSSISWPLNKLKKDPPPYKTGARKETGKISFCEFDEPMPYPCHTQNCSKKLRAGLKPGNSKKSKKGKHSTHLGTFSEIKNGGVLAAPTAKGLLARPGFSSALNSFCLGMAWVWHESSNSQTEIYQSPSLRTLHT